MGTLKLILWQFVIEAMMLTSIVALLALIASKLCARAVSWLIGLPLTRVASAQRAWLDKTLRYFDQLLTCASTIASY
jgi:hypothetical protein